MISLLESYGATERKVNSHFYDKCNSVTSQCASQWQSYGRFYRLFSAMDEIEQYDAGW